MTTKGPKKVYVVIDATDGGQYFFTSKKEQVQFAKESGKGAAKFTYVQEVK